MEGDYICCYNLIFVFYIPLLPKDEDEANNVLDRYENTAIERAALYYVGETSQDKTNYRGRLKSTLREMKRAFTHNIDVIK